VSRLVAVAIGIALLGAAYEVHHYRRGFIQRFFPPGPGGGAAPDLPRAGVPVAALPPAARTRVILIDGLGATASRGLPAYDRLCAAGLELTVDVGFPTVSLPIQMALWTGLTQQQSGIEYAIAQLAPHPGDVPGQLPGSVAVAEGHPEIVGSLGFSSIAADPNRFWFELRAAAAVAGDAPLAFVHILRVDAAGHADGGGSAAYRAAAASADALLGRLVAIDPRPDTRWVLLSDHAHRLGDRGGHGGAEPRIRKVRACLAGALPADLEPPGGAEIHLVDLARAIADSTGTTLPPDSAGRPLAAALAASPVGDRALPRPGPGRWLAATLLIIAAILATAWAARRRLAALPLWWPIAYVSLVLIEEVPTLSVPMVYKPLGRDIYVAALPGLAALAILAALAFRQGGLVRAAVAQLALPGALAAGAAILAGAFAAGPPLEPGWTARASAWMVLGLTGAAVVGLAALATAVQPRSGPSRRSERRGSAP
jgi:hypothetical protein